MSIVKLSGTETLVHLLANAVSEVLSAASYDLQGSTSGLERRLVYIHANSFPAKTQACCGTISTEVATYGSLEIGLFLLGNY